MIKILLVLVAVMTLVTLTFAAPQKVKEIKVRARLVKVLR